jgi:hypothetical protein
MSEITADEAPPSLARKHSEAAIATVASVAITLVVTGLLGWAFGVFSAGVDAGAEQQIRDVVKEMMITDQDLTYAAALAQIDRAVVRIGTKVEGIEADVTDIRGAVRALSSQ